MPDQPTPRLGECFAINRFRVALRRVRFRDEGHICASSTAERGLGTICLRRTAPPVRRLRSGWRRAAPKGTLVGAARLADFGPRARLVDIPGSIADAPRTRPHRLLPPNGKTEHRISLDAHAAILSGGSCQIDVLY